MNGSAATSSGSEGGASPAIHNSQQHHPETAAVNNTNFKIPKVAKIDINKLSIEDQALMQRSLKAFAKERPTKAEAIGVSSSGGSRLRGRAKYAEPSSSESDEEEEADDKESKPSKGKSKFFKHTEKERDDERRRQKDERPAAVETRRMTSMHRLRPIRKTPPLVVVLVGAVASVS